LKKIAGKREGLQKGICIVKFYLANKLSLPFAIEKA